PSILSSISSVSLESLLKYSAAALKAEVWRIDSPESVLSIRSRLSKPSGDSPSCASLFHQSIRSSVLCFAVDFSIPRYDPLSLSRIFSSSSLNTDSLGPYTFCTCSSTSQKESAYWWFIVFSLKCLTRVHIAL